MYPNTSSAPEVADISGTAIDQPARRPSPGWPAESWDLTPAVTTSAARSASTTGPHARPVVVMLGLFTVCGSTVSAVMLEGDEYAWLDLITQGGARTSPLAVVAELASDKPRVEVETSHRHWANRPEIRWHLARQTAHLYRTYRDDRHPDTDSQPSRCPEPRPRPTPGNRSHTTGTGPSSLEG